MKKLRYYATVAFSLILVACSGHGAGSSDAAEEDVAYSGLKRQKAITLPTLEYVTSFPQTMQLREPDPFESEILGALDLVVHDSILYIADRGGGALITGVDKRTGETMGAFLHTGNGPGEMMTSVYLGMYTAEEKKGHLVYNLLDTKRNLVCVDFTQSLKEKHTVMDSTMELGPEPFMYFLFMPDQNAAYGTFVKRSMDGFDRFVHGPTGRKTIPAMDVLNEGCIQKKNDGFLFNIVGVHAGYNMHLSRIVEASIYLNTIHLYGIKDAFGKTLCLGRRLTDVSSIEKGGFQNMRQQALMLKTYPDFLAVLSDDAVRAGQKRPGQSILTFDWDGNPIARFILDREISGFDFDVYSGELFVLDPEEKIWTYPLQSDSSCFTSGRRFEMIGN